VRKKLHQKGVEFTPAGLSFSTAKEGKHEDFRQGRAEVEQKPA
jgi:hypothetical protein